MKRRFALLSIALLMPGVVWGMTADELTQKTGVAGGLCAFPHASKDDVALALELAQRPTFVVHILSNDETLLAHIRGDTTAAGLLGKSLYVEPGGAGKLPYADRLADVLYISNLTDADLTPEARAEWLRVLSPRRGAALVGSAAKTGLSPEKLKAWVGNLPLSSAAADASGAWALLRADLPAGSEAWSHRLHGPDNAQSSADSTLHAPFLTQWWGLPRQEGFWGTTVVACNGRMFTVRGSRNAMAQVTMTARSQDNGIVLWQRDLSLPGPDGKKIAHGGFIPGRSCAVATADSLYLADRGGVLRLNAETGALRTRIDGPVPAGQVKWIAVSDKLLVLLAGDADTITPISYQTVASNPVGRNLLVYDTEAEKVLWQDTVAGDIDERMIALRDGQLYCLAQGLGMVCRDLKTGQVQWTNTEPELQAEFKTPELKIIKEFLVSLPVLSALPDVLILRAKWVKNTVALSRKDGALLWRKPTAGGSYRGLTACAIGDTWVGGGKPLSLLTGDLTTGAAPTFISSGCGPTTCTPNYMITCFGKVLDLKTNAVIRAEDIKSPCDVGTIVSDGMMITMPSECGCLYETKGYRALTSAGAITPHTAGPWQERLSVRDTSAPAELKLTDADWPTYRHDAKRSGASAATVGNVTKILWQWTPPGAAPYASAYAFALGQNLKPDYVATAAVAADGRVWFGSADGVVHCVEAANGKELWNYPTGAMLFKPPTLWHGRALVGGGDGRIYCLNAMNGKCLWQFQAAPSDRRLFWYGHMLSTWPVLTGVAVDDGVDGVAYAIAGSQKENGIHAYAFEPETGKVLWENDKAGAGGPAGLSCGGGVAVGAGKLFMQNGCFDLKTGEAAPLKLPASLYGSEVGVFDQWWLQGGRRLSEAEETIAKPMGGSGFVFAGIDPKLGAAALTDASASLPAWDAADVLLPPRALHGPLALVPAAKLLAWMPEYVTARAAFDKAPREAKPKLDDWPDLKTWATDPLLPAAFVLTRDEAVVTCTDGKIHKACGFARTDGKLAWTVALPEQPAMNRIAVDRDGRILVSLSDGSVVCLGK